MATAAPEIPVLARDQAFEALYRSYVKDVYHYALALLRNPADAEDVTQTTFLNAYRAYQRGIEIEKPHNWLIKIAHNVARTRYARASRRVKEVPLEDHVEQLAVPEAEQPDVVGVLRALGRLPFNQRAALVMRELEGRTYAEIADTIGVSVSAVETLIFRARRSLRLKASALRALGAVPLPSSLTQLFGGGGVVAGGGAAVGTGFLVKAAVAIVAAALGTGLAGDRSRPATAAADPSTGFVGVAPSSKGGQDGLKAQQVRKLGVRGGKSAASKGSPASPATGGTGDVVAVDAGTQQASAGQSASPTSNTQVSSTKSGPVSQVTAPVSDLTGSVQQVVEATTTALPVQAPSLPAPPVAVPPLPIPPPPPPPLPLP
ncbi:MAG: RNA polymerase sigma factor [Actinomycetota bacterium]|nr:RNA polymerase sigma factor [Actinomycetota bacterium]